MIIEQQELLGVQVPKHYLPKIIKILKSGVLNTKSDKVEIHFDHDGNIRRIYGPRFLDEN